MKKYSSKIALTLLIIVSAFMLSTKSNDSKNKDAGATENTKLVKKDASFLLERFNTVDTKKVTNKLDSLLKRINKRHDFHGALLVAKNGKILYNNQIGYADFRKR